MASFTLNQVTAIGSAYTSAVERGGYIYIPRYSGGSFAGSVDKVDISNNTVVSTIDIGVYSKSGGVFSLSLDSSNDILVTNQDGFNNNSGGSIHKISTSDVVTLFLSPVTSFRDWITFWCNGFYYSFGSDSGGGTILTKITTGGSPTNIGVSNIGAPQYGATIGNNIYVTGSSYNNIYKYDTVANTFTSFAIGTGISGSLSNRGGNLYYSISGIGYIVDLSTGALTSTDTLTSGKESNLLWASNNYLYSVTASAGLNKSTTTYGSIGGSTTNSGFFNFM